MMDHHDAGLRVRVAGGPGGRPGGTSSRTALALGMVMDASSAGTVNSDSRSTLPGPGHWHSEGRWLRVPSRGAGGPGPAPGPAGPSRRDRRDPGPAAAEQPSRDWH